MQVRRQTQAKLYKEKFNYDIYGFPVSGYTFSLNTEIVASARYVTERLSPKAKPCRVIQWSGSCDPTETALRVADEAGILNINGGDTYTDAVMPSLTTVSGLVNPVGKRMQVYTGQANENILTNLWTGPFHGYRDIIEAMRFTETPRRLMPINIYYHFYSAEKHASLRALQDVHEWGHAAGHRPAVHLAISRNGEGLDPHPPDQKCGRPHYRARLRHLPYRAPA